MAHDTCLRREEGNYCSTRATHTSLTRRKDVKKHVCCGTVRLGNLRTVRRLYSRCMTECSVNRQYTLIRLKYPVHSQTLLNSSWVTMKTKEEKLNSN